MLALILTSCSTSRSAHEAPFVPGTPIGRVHAIRDLMRVRATHGQRTESFRAQLVVEPATRRVELTAYTPLGTSAMTLFADGDRVTFLNHIDQTQWQGSAREVAFFGGIEPATWALAILGYPVDTGGLMVMTRDAAGNVTIVRGSNTVEITQTELTSTDASPRAPAIPREYRCCVAPAL
jgi:hypothetical protein